MRPPRLRPVLALDHPPGSCRQLLLRQDLQKFIDYSARLIAGSGFSGRALGPATLDGVRIRHPDKPSRINPKMKGLAVASRRR
jgi:hypothetical protein